MGRRSVRLPTSTVVAALPDFVATARLRKTVARHVGPLSDEMEEHLVQIIRRYKRDAQFEKSAPTVRDAKKRLARIQKAATDFGRALLEGGGGSFHADQYVDGLIDDRLRKAPQGVVLIAQRGRIDKGNVRLRFKDILRTRLDAHDSTTLNLSLRVLEELAAELEYACQDVERQLADDAARDRHAPGDAWRTFVRDLDGFWRKLGKKASARKDSDIAKSDEPSAFVAFVSDVQRVLPTQLARHTQSLDALAAGVSAAKSRRARKREP